MSDSNGNFSDNFLELAAVTGEKRKRNEGSPKSETKRREADSSMNTTSDSGCEKDDVEENPYPLDGKYIDEYDRQRLLEMPELERELIAAQRFEEVQRIRDMRNLDRMLEVQKGREGDSGAKAAKHKHGVRGANNGKSQKLDELKARWKANREAKRKARDERKQVRASPARSPSIVFEPRGSPMRDRSLSPMDLETSDEEADITKSDQEEKDLKLLGIAAHNDEPITIADINKVRLTRDNLAKYVLLPSFKDYVRGAYIRYPVGSNKHRNYERANNYRIYEICHVQMHSRLYNIKDGVTCKLALRVKHGTSKIVALMDRVSNEDFNAGEFSCFKNAWEDARIKLPTKGDLEKKGAQMRNFMGQSMTNSDTGPDVNRAPLERGGPERPEQARMLALRKGEVRPPDRLPAELRHHG